ncbi:hypothetical protein L6E12_32485 [Actinokineospora sp. PR83]|uniref:hypothetical protein n=1 Tax=Actinokineospora sp. PR83 TaxID=2884908 RepID=UPI001F3F0F1E|nr:hypothetical protein [Actinokineospora sp. PR83]MCG8920495.1 hypothetical protein [Actinokineospora sp. PR83]
MLAVVALVGVVGGLGFLFLLLRLVAVGKVSEVRVSVQALTAFSVDFRVRAVPGAVVGVATVPRFVSLCVET